MPDIQYGSVPNIPTSSVLPVVQSGTDVPDSVPQQTNNTPSSIPSNTTNGQLADVPQVTAFVAPLAPVPANPNPTPNGGQTVGSVFAIPTGVPLVAHPPGTV